METPANRLKKARQAAGFESAREFAHRVGENPVTVRAHENGSRGIKPEKARKYARALKVDPAWLLYGEGAGPSASSAKPEREQTQSRHENVLSLPESSIILEMDVNASAGAGAVVEYEHQAHLWAFPEAFVWSELSARPKDLRILTVEGDSMLSNPYQRGDIEPGDKVVVNVSDIRPSPPGIFIMYDGLGLVAKRVEYIHHPTHPVVRIMSNNVAYETYERTVEEAFIQGRVVGRWQRL